VIGYLGAVESRPPTAGLLIACTTTGLPASGLSTVVGVVDGDTLVIDLDDEIRHELAAA